MQRGREIVWGLLWEGVFEWGVAGFGRGFYLDDDKCKVVGLNAE